MDGKAEARRGGRVLSEAMLHVRELKTQASSLGPAQAHVVQVRSTALLLTHVWYPGTCSHTAGAPSPPQLYRVISSTLQNEETEGPEIGAVAERETHTSWWLSSCLGRAAWIRSWKEVFSTSSLGCIHTLLLPQEAPTHPDPLAHCLHPGSPQCQLSLLKESASSPVSDLTTGSAAEDLERSGKPRGKPSHFLRHGRGWEGHREAFGIP